MDGPSVNEKFEEQAAKRDKEGGAYFLKIDIFPMHISNDSFENDLKDLKSAIDLDQFAVSISVFCALLLCNKFTFIWALLLQNMCDFHFSSLKCKPISSFSLIVL